MPNDYNPFEGRGQNPPGLKIKSGESDPALRKLIEQQQRVERSMSTIDKLGYAKQRDSGDDEFNYQGPQHFRGKGHRGTKDRMPGTTPIPNMNPLDWLLEKLRIRKNKNQRKPVKIKGTGNLV